MGGFNPISPNAQIKSLDPYRRATQDFPFRSKGLAEEFLKALGMNDNDIEAVKASMGLLPGLGIGAGPATPAGQMNMMPQYGMKNPRYAELFKRKFEFDPLAQKLVRYQREEVPFPVSAGERGGIFFSKKGYGDGYQHGGVEGGRHKVETTFEGKTPYLLRRDVGFIGPHILEKELGVERLPYTYKDLPDKLKKLITEKEFKQSYNSDAGMTALQEKLAFKYLNSRGFDSVVSLQPKGSRRNDVNDKYRELEDTLGRIIHKLTRDTEKRGPHFGNSIYAGEIKKLPEELRDKVWESYTTKLHNLSEIPVTRGPYYDGPERFRLADKVQKALNKGKISDINSAGTDKLDAFISRGGKLPDSIASNYLRIGTYSPALRKLAERLVPAGGQRYYPSQFVDIRPEIIQKNLRKWLEERERLASANQKPSPQFENTFLDDWIAEPMVPYNQPKASDFMDNLTSILDKLVATKGKTK
jgi:hypothetical protein